jgi:hypothetical protein
MLQFHLLDEGWMLFENLDGARAGEVAVRPLLPREMKDILIAKLGE